MALPMIIGSETEYGLTVVNDPEFDSIATALLLVNSYNVDQSLKLLWDYDQEDPLVDARGFELDDDYDVPDQQDNMAINKVLPNGARFYVDHAHPEFSTPECSNVLDLLRYEKAGERILNLSRIHADQMLPDDRSIIIYKNNSDQKGNKLRLPRKLSHGSPHAVSGHCRTVYGLLGDASDLLWRGQSRVGKRRRLRALSNLATR